MNRKERAAERDARLRALLREADPAAGEPGLDPRAVQTMRREVLAAAPEPHRRGVLAPALAGSAALAGVALLALAFWWSADPQGSQPERMAATPEASSAASPASTGAGSRPYPSASTPASSSPGISGPVRPPSASPATSAPLRRGNAAPPRLRLQPPVRLARAAPPAIEEPALQVDPAVPEGRQIQFSTPGGTRVIWVLGRAAG